MNFSDIIIYLLVGLIVIASIAIVFSKNVFYSTLYLLICLVSLAGIYALLNSEFVAITQLVIYAGGIIVLILFGIMLTNRISGKPLVTENQNRFVGFAISLSLMIILILSVKEFPDVVLGENQKNHIKMIGVELMSTYVAPLEIGGMLLLICVMGAAFTSSTFKRNRNVE
jgi:NADH-quinone oxidoreductase subunit J